MVTQQHTFWQTSVKKNLYEYLMEKLLNLSEFRGTSVCTGCDISSSRIFHKNLVVKCEMQPATLPLIMGLTNMYIYCMCTYKTFQQCGAMQMQNTFILGSSAIWVTKQVWYIKVSQESQITFKIDNFKPSIAFRKGRVIFCTST